MSKRNRLKNALFLGGGRERERESVSVRPDGSTRRRKGGEEEKEEEKEEEEEQKRGQREGGGTRSAVTLAATLATTRSHPTDTAELLDKL